MSKYDEDLKKACEILNNTELDELLKVAVEAMDDAAVDIGMEANQEWHAKITLESALIHIAEKVAKRPQLTIPKSIADELDEIPNEAKRYVRESGFDDYSILDDFVELQELYEADEDETFPRFTGLKEFVKDNLNLCTLYLAGKALGVDLVKVVER
ncbi:hypothetical protein B9W73_03575 [Lactococcus lactis]|uniref:hypothetical protein n=1 Tax=Lactococcus lactis TaxID=1358 RepID=UPI000A1E8C15|nr:hypothetical protein [Lactococcus lactis]OSP87364.1 hypothetical protein B9W73_03575 [Lactococcus lactis]